MTAGSLDDRLARALDALSDDLLAYAVPSRFVSLAFPEGHAPLAIAHAAFERVRPGRGHASRVDEHLARAAKALSGRATDPMLFGGFTGVAWTIEHLRGGDGGDRTGAVEAAIARYLSVERWDEPFDLLSGLVGYGVYALERLPRASAAEIVERVVAHLCATATRVSPGIAWRSRAEWVAEAVRSPSDAGYNLGLAHGVPGVVAFLARVVRAGVAKGTASQLLEGAVAWLLAQEADAGSPSAFPYIVDDGQRGAPARAAWGYGDAGVAIALLLAARASGEPAWKRAALRIAARAAARDERGSGVEDAGLCHGAGGLVHMFRRLYVETEDARFDAASRRWLDRALALRVDKGTLAYRAKSLVPTAKSPRIAWRRDMSFLTGAAGTDTALASFALEPGRGWSDWDRVLLLS